jgi:hypothetical protein
MKEGSSLTTGLELFYSPWHDRSAKTVAGLATINLRVEIVDTKTTL